VIDGEACACDDKGWPDFHAILGGGRAYADACYFAFDLLELDGVDLRGVPFGERYARLDRLLADAPELIHLSEHTNEFDGAAMFKHACRLGLEGIVAKRRSGRYRSGRCVTWIKVKNPGYQRPSL
jgi:bifunctional non-homologous end joining protein LigD